MVKPTKAHKSYPLWIGGWSFTRCLGGGGHLRRSAVRSQAEHRLLPMQVPLRPGPPSALVRKHGCKTTVCPAVLTLFLRLVPRAQTRLMWPRCKRPPLSPSRAKPGRPCSLISFLVFTGACRSATAKESSTHSHNLTRLPVRFSPSPSTCSFATAPTAPAHQDNRLTLSSFVTPPHPSPSFINTLGFVNGVYPGLSASIFRQMTYSLTRFGVYDALKEQFSQGLAPGESLPPWKLAVAASIAGGLGGVAGNPADVVLVRMTGDGNRPPGQRLNYKHWSVARRVAGAGAHVCLPWAGMGG